MTQEQQPRLHTALAAWRPLFSPPSHSTEEAADLLPVLLLAAVPPPRTLIELGCGGGSLAHHLKGRLQLTLTDRWTEMLAVSRAAKPEFTGGEDGPDGRGLRYLEWSWDPDPTDDTYEVAFAFLLREPSGTVRVESDRHRFGLFPRATWLHWIEEAGFSATSRTDPWHRDVFIATRPPRR